MKSKTQLKAGFNPQPDPPGYQLPAPITPIYQAPIIRTQIG
jgi:hypothetical protein